MIQSASRANDEMCIVFSVLYDVLHVLGIKDEDDIESLLIKKVDTSTTKMIQFPGTISIANQLSTTSERSNYSVTSGSGSISTSSKPSNPKLHIFTATCPFTLPNSDAESSEKQYDAVCFHQDCVHFSESRSCYLSNFEKTTFKTALNVPDPFEFIDTVRLSAYSRYFIMKWTREKPPSQSTWTRDAREGAVNSPGNIQLCIPFVFTNSSRIVNLLSDLLDDNIETFMELRSSLYNNLSH